MPIYFDYKRTPEGLKRVHRVLNLFDTYLERLGTSYAAADHLTIADFPLINSTMALEVIDFDFSQYQRVGKRFISNEILSWHAPTTLSIRISISFSKIMILMLTVPI